MYSRKTGVLQTSSEGLKKIENFNKNLREQYNTRNKAAPNTASYSQNKSVMGSNDLFSGIGNLISSEEFVLVALMLLLIFDVNKDFLIIGILAMLLLLD